MALLLIAMAHATQAQQTTSTPQVPSQQICRQITVFGAVRTPGRLDTTVRLRLLEVLGKVGGPNERAGKTVRIVHTCNCSPCEKLEMKPGDVNEFNLVDVLRGDENGNPFVAPGDIVIVPEAELVFVIGAWREIRILFVRGMTVTRAIAMAGGLISSSALTTIRIYRTSSNGRRPEPIMINLKAITEGRAEDPLLKPLDLVYVSDDQGHFRPLRLSPPTWDPPLPKLNPPLHPRKEASGPTLITSAFRRGGAYCIDSARL